MFALGRKAVFSCSQSLARFYCQKPPDHKNFKLERISRRPKLSPGARLETLLPPKAVSNNTEGIKDDSKVLASNAKEDDSKVLVSDAKEDDSKVLASDAKDDSKVLDSDAKEDGSKVLPSVADDSKVLPSDTSLEGKRPPEFLINKTGLPPRFLRRKYLSPWARLEALSKEDKGGKN